MTRIFICPGKYIQGKGELLKLGKYSEVLEATKALILASESGYKRVEHMVDEAFKNSSCSFQIEKFSGECTSLEIDRIIKIVKSSGCDIVIGIGGGKIADTAKAVAFYTNLPVIIAPTSASTDAACSALSVIYNEDGVVEKYLTLPTNPNIVLMDTELIAASPTRLTVAGMGDALATYFETRAVVGSRSKNMAGGNGSKAAVSLSKLCYDTLLQEGAKAKLALEAGVCTESVENIIEANTLLSGLGFESGGLAGAHSIHNGLTVIEEVSEMLHGEKVAFGTLVQLVLENAPFEEIEKVAGFCIEIGLPVTLRELGMKEVTKERVIDIASLACAEGETIYNMPCEINKEIVCDAILAADSMGRYFLSLYE